MRSLLEKPTKISLRLFILVAILMGSTWSFHLSADAQGEFTVPRVVRSLSASEFGQQNAKGLAFSAVSDTFLLVGDADTALLTMLEDSLGSLVAPDVQADPLNTAFDAKSKSFVTFNRPSAEILQVAADAQGLPAAAAKRFEAKTYGIQDAQGITFNPETGQMFILDAGKAQIVAISPHETMGFGTNGVVTTAHKISLQKFGFNSLKGLAYNPSNGHLYFAEPSQGLLHEFTQSGDFVVTFDLASAGVASPSAMVFAPSVDNTDDPGIYDLFVLDLGQAPKASLFSFTSTRQQTLSSEAQLVELSLITPEALPAGTTLLPTSLVNIIEASTWNPPSPDTSGVDYWPLHKTLMAVDSEVNEMSIFQGKNVYETTTSGTLVSTCFTTYSNEPTGIAINPNNNHFFISDDNGSNDKVYEVDLGPDQKYCTADDSVTITNVAAAFGATDAEDVAYGNNTLYIADGANAEVYRVPLGADGVLGGGDDGPVTHFDTYALGFVDMEGLGYNTDANTLFIISPNGKNRYLGETSLSGNLLRAYDLSLMGTGGNKRSDVTYAPGSKNPAVKMIYIASRNIDNNSDRNENDGQIWEINIGSSGSSSTATPSKTPTKTSTPTAGPTVTPTSTSTPGPTPTATNTPSVTDIIFADGFESGNFSAWSSTKTGSGDLSVSNAAALVGGKGMQALINDTGTMYLIDETPNAEARYRARFYFDPNSITMASGNSHHIFRGYSGSSTNTLRLLFRYSSGNYEIKMGLRNDGSGWSNTSWITISDAPHAIEFDWQAATAVGANNGRLTLWVDGVQKAQVTGVDNDTRRIERIRLGPLASIDAGTSGTYYFDNFESRRQTYIGP